MPTCPLQITQGRALGRGASELVEDWPDDIRDAPFDTEQAEESLRRAESIAKIVRPGDAITRR
jgi:hypothetical protein